MTKVSDALTTLVDERRDLSEAEAYGVLDEIMSGAEVPASQIGALLTALRMKGESIDEIVGFARVMREKAVRIVVPGVSRIVDVVGTGGDAPDTFNVSTAAAFVVAGCGVTVAKHGNRAMSSRCGSADVLEALGIPTDLSPAEAAAAMAAEGFAFLFAPNYHPAFKHIGPARKLCAERGQRTLFNFLGPLLNPARPTAQLIGVPRADLTEPMAQVLQSLGIARGMVVSGRAGDQPMDELSALGENTLSEYYQANGFSTSTLAPADLSLAPATLADLAGGDAADNAEIIRAILAGSDHGPKREAVLLNAGAALFVAGEAEAIGSGMELAAAVIDDGRAAAKLDALATRYA